LQLALCFRVDLIQICFHLAPRKRISEAFAPGSLLAGLVRLSGTPVQACLEARFAM
jgi:hypothetical protein